MNKKNKNNKGFTLIELLAVIVILGLLMAIAIPSVTRYITQSRRKTVVTSIDSYVTSVMTEVNDGEYHFSDASKVFAIPIECVSLEKGGTNPFGNWLQANTNYWAYVLVQYDSENYNYVYGFTFKDDAGYGMYPTSHANIDEGGSQIKTGYDDLNKPTNGTIAGIVDYSKWNGFKVTNDTVLVVLEATSEGGVGDGKTTCTLCQKGDNYEQVEKEKENQEETEPSISTPLYFGKKYNAINLETVPNEEYVVWGYAFYEDGHVDIYINDELSDLKLPAGSIQYTDTQVLQNGVVTHNISTDKKTLVPVDGSGSLKVDDENVSDLYFGKKYSMTSVENGTQHVYSYVCYEDGSSEYYVDGILKSKYSAGTFKYVNVAILMDGKTAAFISEDRKEVTLIESITGMNGTFKLEN